MTDMVILDYFSGSIGEMKVADQSDRTKVLSVLSRDPEFSVFDATERPGIAQTLDRLATDGLIDYPEPRPGYPWMRARVTEAGQKILKATYSPSINTTSQGDVA